MIPKPTLVGIDEVTGDSEVDMFKYLKQSDRNPQELGLSSNSATDGFNQTELMASSPKNEVL